MNTLVEKSAISQHDSLAQTEEVQGQSRKAPAFNLSATPPPASNASEGQHNGPQAEAAMEGRENGEQFEADETHTIWVQPMGDQDVVMVASTPMPVHTRLFKWRKEANKMGPSKLKENILEWIEKGLKKTKEMSDANSIVDLTQRNQKRHDVAAQLKEILKKLFWAFDQDMPSLGAAAVYRGLHFSTDWQERRGRTVTQEANRTFDEVKGEGTFSTATWEIAKSMARGGNITPELLETANDMVMRQIEIWKQTTDDNRLDTSPKGKAIAAQRTNLEKGAEANALTNPLVAQNLRTLRENMKGEFSQGKNVFQNQFQAALSKYINNQKDFETDLKGKSDGSYKDINFEGIPFISTSKEPGEAAKYAQGKLADPAVKSTVGVVGRIMVYVAPRENLLEAGGIDVWEELGAGRLKFTDWRMNENEITFAGKIPESFHGGMTPVNGNETVQAAADRAEEEAKRVAAPFGGLNKLPKNKAHD
jgi:hypothetical protein